LAYRITGECIGCGACEPECRNEAISEGEAFNMIDPDKCTECVGWFDSPRCAEVCPVDGACGPDPEHQETKELLLVKWRNLHPAQEPTPGTY
jgi:ferredoxin